MVDSTDVTVVMCNGYARSDEHYHALNDAPIRRLIGRNGSAMGKSTPQIQTRWRVCPHRARRVTARWECQSETRQTRLVLVVSEVCAGEYDAGRVREGSTRGSERAVG